MRKLYGLIGFPLTHSFSKKYFTEKFVKENIQNSEYQIFELENINDFSNIWNQNPDLLGLNVTIPHKQTVIPFLKYNLDDSAKFVGAVNVIKKEKDGSLKGYNSDYYGFKESLIKLLPENYHQLSALVLGTGGASKAVEAALETLEIPYQLVSRNGIKNLEIPILSYQEIDEKAISSNLLIINTTPLGMYPNLDTCPDIPYQFISSNHILFDLVYNPEETLFLKKGKEKGAKTQYGMEMLHLQAEKAWEIWNK